MKEYQNPILAFFCEHPVCYSCFFLFYIECSSVLTTLALHILSSKAVNEAVI